MSKRKMARFKEDIFFFVSVCLFFVRSQELHPCPDKCVCFRTTVRCMFLQLDRIPSPLPPETTVLDLRFNRIRDIPRNAFIGLNRLSTLLINNNHIKRLDDGAFASLPELRYLYLYKNQISSIEADTFRNLGKLEQLFLHHNNITRMPDGMLTYSPNLQRIRIDNNPLICDCQMLWFTEMIRTRLVNLQVAATCHSPSGLRGQSLANLRPADFICELPRFTLEPSDVSVSFGSSVHFNCRAEGTPTPDITWLHNEVEIDIRDNRIQQAADGTLMILETRDSDKGVYECVANNAAGQVKTKKVLLSYTGEYVSPRLTLSPEDVTAIEGHSVRLSCQASGQPEPQITWLHDRRSVSNSPRHTLETSGNLLISGVVVEDGGLYECQAINLLGSTSAQAFITVQVPPTFTRRPSNHNAFASSTTMFRCEVAGTPTPTITWLFDGRPLTTTRRIQVLEEGSLLRISQAQHWDQGTYTCRAVSDAGTQEASAVLTISQSTRTQEFPSNREIETFLGSNSILECETEDPNLQYRWIKDQNNIRPSSKYSVQDHRLIIRNVVAEDAGKYECFPANTVGFSRQAILLKIKVGDGRNYDGDAFVREAIVQARNRVNQAVNDTMAHLFDRNRQHTIQDLITIFRYPSAEALELARAEEIFEQTLEIVYRHVRDGHEYDLKNPEKTYREVISPGHLTLIANMSGCFANPRITRCSNMCYHRKYRTMDGTCNNLKSPLWGATVTAFRRLLQPIYENGFNTPVGWNPSRQYNDQHLPSPRLVSSFLMSADHVTEDEVSTHMLMQWGQFVDHDMDLTPQSISYARFSDGRRCNETCENAYPCFPISVPRSDSRIQSYPCLGFSRSSAMCNSGSTSIFYKTFAPRQQINAITAFIDASNVYGSSEFDIQRLRELTNSRGLMREGPISSNRKRLLPFDNAGFLHHFDCQIEPSKQHVPCFRAGDHRANEHIALTAMHTLWMRQHNHIAVELGKINTHWDGNMIFHESRKIIGAMMQHITYKHWLPNIIGKTGMEMLGEYQGYDPHVDPSISNEFATAAMRFGHSLVQPIIFRLNASFQSIPEGNLPLHKSFFSPYRLLEEGGIDPLLRGMFVKSSKKRMPSEMMNSELTEKLFTLANVVAQDLASLNIQRGRDHGLPFYNDYREYCKLPRARTFEEFSNEVTDFSIRDKLQALYGHPDNIDLFVGGMSETPLPGAKVGPTFMCIMVDQFRRIRSGDRFWYENPNVFKPEQLTSIKDATLARVLCDSGDKIDRVQPNVFIMANNDTAYLPCKKIPDMNLKVWAECCSDCEQAGDFQSITSEFRRGPPQSHREDREHGNHVGTRDRGYQNTMAAFESQMAEMKSGMNVFDSRMEGMENIIHGLKKTIKQLRRKMKKMQKHMKNSVLPKNKCNDETGKVRQTNERWKVHDCKECVCKYDGRIECDNQMCPLPQCNSPRKVQGKCCPVC